MVAGLGRALSIEVLLVLCLSGMLCIRSIIVVQVEVSRRLAGRLLVLETVLARRTVRN